ncbi:DUF2993 domain-containing protein [Nodularia sphaerocarpa]|uniref:LmeA family phospholipid-binding protein n=1 Tax=Nodularia sphaerocarpa TaxID=137816 RepID=UPI001EFC15E7|nr:DUF2993 domain-containing protein [Nodularia sphaerocarpa]MDB9373071.1 DUF2993 domain-containing protein [Nodularia sphaerocarpa CS-585]MDB9378722.1 DUF2993 domain-containing protein [Nodularia sphaerocarpa CS-585A2]ULP74519.1 hypothetical protein BDGGKGIB_04188 [Nodularia sphaerocarpa UHCC 0038]
MTDNQRLEEKFVSHQAERRVSDKLDEAEQIDINVETDVLKIVQGQAEKVSVTGQGLVIQKNIRVQEIQLQTDNIAINPLSAIFGQIELNQPVNAVARIVLTKTDINLALTSELIRSLVKNFPLNVEGEIISFEPQQIDIFLPGDDKIGFNATGLLKSGENTHLLGVTVTFRPRTNSQPILLESVTCTEGEGISVELILAFMHKLKELANLPFLKWEDIAFRIINMEIAQDSIILMIEANVKQISASQIEFLEQLQ